MTFKNLKRPFLSLFDNQGFGLDNGDALTVDGGPYIYRPPVVVGFEQVKS